MSADSRFDTMNEMRKEMVQKENNRTLSLLTEVLREQIALAMQSLEEQEKQLWDEVLQKYNTHTAHITLKLSLLDFYARQPEGQEYRLYWQPMHIAQPQAMEVILRTSRNNTSSDDPLANLLTGCTLPILEEFRQVLRQRYPKATISSHHFGGNDPFISIYISYTLPFQQGIPVMTCQKRTTGGGVIWHTDTIQRSI